MIGFATLPIAVGSNIICKWIKLKDLVKLDSAYSNHSMRSNYLNYCQSGTIQTEEIVLRSSEQIQWFISRKLKFRKLATSSLQWQEGTDTLLSELLDSVGSHIKEINISYSESSLSSIQIICLHTIVGQKCINIQKVHIASDLTDTEVEPLLCAWKSIQELILSYCKITNAVFYSLCDSLGRLRSLFLFCMPDICDAGLTAMAGKCPELVELLILHCDRFTAKGMINLVKTTPKLTIIRIRMPDLTDIDMTTIAQHCPILHTVELSSARLVTDVAIQGIVNSCSQLSSIQLSNCTSISTGLCLLRNLKRFDIYDSTTLTDAMVVNIVENNPFLERLLLMHCTSLTPTSVLTILHGCPQLHTLTVTNTIIGNTVPTGHSDCYTLSSLIKKQYPKITMLDIELK